MTYLCENCDHGIDIDEHPRIKWSIWLDGPLKYNDIYYSDGSYNDSYDKEHKRMSNEKVILKCLDNSQNNVNEFILNEAKPYIINKDHDTDGIIYGISQDPNTKDYIMVLNDYRCEKCAIWLDGPLKYNKNTNWERVPNEKVALEFSHNSNNITNKILHKVKQIYGISRNPDTNDYVIIFQDFYCRNCGNQYTNIRYKWCEQCQINYLKQDFANWTSGDEIIDKFIQEMQLKIESYEDIIVEWIPYDQFINIKEISNSSTQYTAMWVNGPLQYERKKHEYERLSNGKVALKCLGNLQTITNEFFNKV
ncbi:kinase-like domain-containing protein [Rhizophagus clarus]|uniref:Kinase-like domain-containing protein n=1 Tax=Rhizophagus clarus TaxID=94130 RepID=A0A8H3QKD3_9GLOM|nr:kinase-like domain-containing protein [Rhizophagus clarus]